MRRILVTQSDGEAAEELTNALREQGFEIENVHSIEEALQKVEREPWDLIILDIRGPQEDCFEICRYVREHTAAPIVILSELGQDEYIIKGLNAGADGYLVKPISTEVFLAHIHALLRRTDRMGKEGERRVLKQGDLVIDFDRREVSVRGEPVKLTASEFRLLSYLAKNPGRVLSSRSLVREVLGYDCSPTEARDIIKVHIYNLRRKMRLSSRKPPYIKNVRGVGYMFERRASPREGSVNKP